MLHPDLELRWISEVVGYGVFARGPIGRGTIIWAQDALDIVLPAGSPLAEHPDYAGIIERYCVLDGSGRRVIAWDHGKYINHCCHYNCLATAWGFELAIRAIEAGEEITEDYAAFNPLEAIELVCRFADCRKVVRPGDFDRYWRTWDDQIQAALQDFRRVEQPLLKYLESGVVKELDDYLASGRGYRSIERLRFDL
jgi:hypothetical protein